MKKGREGYAAWWEERRERIKGMQWGDLSSVTLALMPEAVGGVAISTD